MQDLLMSSDGEGPSMSSLPAHIAARFCRPALTRRKTSAASSRRNSLSSLHSNRSNRSAHGGPQSTHIAQHLRRASIIESRKARLADKAAHAEQVRLRAALAKAAPRMSTNREDRALAAQQAREKYLAQVAASCAEEVKRAKKVAEDMREKKAAEHLKLKGNIEERFADAEKRRLHYQQNLRRTRFPILLPVEEKKIAIIPWKPHTQEIAAKVIQKAWRNRRRRQDVNTFQQLGLNIANVQKQSFEELSNCLGQESTLLSTANVLQLCGLKDGEGGGLGENTAVRVFLSAFIVFGHPEHVLSQKGQQEQDLIRKAKQLLVSFDQLLTASTKGINFSPLPGHLAMLSNAFADFQTAFTAWKNHDSSVIIETMVAQFVELDAIWQTVKNDTEGHVAEDYREGIQKNQTLLLVQLKRLAGQEKALAMVREAVQARRRTKVKKRPLSDERPREVAIAPELPALVDNGATFHSDHKIEPSSTVTQPYKAEILEKLAGPLPPNRVIVHELAINKEYKIEPSTFLSREKTNRSAFDAMRRNIENGYSNDWIVSVARIVRNKLLQMVTPGKPFHILISETLDLDLIQNQVQNGSFAYENFFAFMNTILPKLCAPVRDPEVKALAADQSGDFVGRLERLIHVIDLLLLDFANHQLNALAPSLCASSTDYEKRCFSERMGNRKLKNAIRWWKQARERLLTGAFRRLAEQDYHSPIIHLPLDKIYAQGLTDLFICLPPLQHTDVPETLELDRDRIERNREDVLRIIIISTILLTAKNLLKRDVRSQWKAEAQRMWELPSYQSAAPFLTVIESAHALPPSTRTTLSGTIERVLADARNPETMSHPVLKVLLQKLKNHVMSRLGASSAEERLRSTTSASEVLAGGGMAEFVGRIGGIVDEMGKVKSVDWAAHGKWLDEVAAEVAGDATA
ncbi:hypothetical protein MMC13_001778 [Lambiella insularis]|nr:hypothetical protein [Lambiella insularis]